MSLYAFKIKPLLIVIAVQLLPCALSAQLKLSNCIYIANKDRHFLSEKIKLENGNYQVFNSLFIWEKDRVTRIIFKQVKKQHIPKGTQLKNMPSFESIMPPIQRYKLLEKKYPAAKVRIFYNQLDDIAFKGMGKEQPADARYDERNGNTYASVLKITINNWNAKHNPLADRLGEINISDGNPNVLIKNTKRKGDYANNFPLVYQLTNDSLCIIKPYVINVYRLNPQPTLSALANREFPTYTLYSTVSLMEDSFLDQYKEGEFYSVGRLIAEATLKQLHKITSPLYKNSLTTFLSKFKQPDQKIFTVVPQHSVQEDNTAPSVTPEQNTKTLVKKIAEDSLKATEKTALRNYDEYPKYCPDCYTDKITKSDKLKIHCLFTVFHYPGNVTENWKYAFTQNNRHYFETEIENYSSYERERDFYSDDPPDGNNHAISRQLLSPGIGYWLSNTKGNSVCDSKNIEFVLDGEIIKN